MVEHKRLLELALKGLKAERLRVDDEIAAIRGQLNKNAAPRATRLAPASRNRPAVKAQSRRGSSLTPEGRKKLSDLMKKRWAERRKAAAKK
jgi:Spy/CpxP family protein refolding chaperone